MSDAKLLQLQFVLFFKTIENRPDKLINKVDTALVDIFDQMPNITNLPPDAPLEIPRVTMQSSDGLYACNIGKNRIDLFGYYQNSGSTIGANLEVFVNKMFLLAEEIFNDKEIIRYGLVGQYFIEQANAINKIATKYMKLDTEDVEEVNIRFNRNILSSQLKMNDIVEISRGSVMYAGVQKGDGIFITRDLNNKPVDALNFETLKKVVELNKSKFMLSGIQELID
ncbi:hypothetical protein [Lysinibacillus sp. FW12]|uniref:hypothetical protein n=1 Tax=Lysinibacillus sp. FW12 TaxID=3096079 RepID=UPI003D70804F